MLRSKKKPALGRQHTLRSRPVPKHRSIEGRGAEKGVGALLETIADDPSVCAWQTSSACVHKCQNTNVCTRLEAPFEWEAATWLLQIEKKTWLLRIEKKTWLVRIKKRHGCYGLKKRHGCYGLQKKTWLLRIKKRHGCYYY